VPAEEDKGNRQEASGRLKFSTVARNVADFHNSDNVLQAATGIVAAADGDRRIKKILSLLHPSQNCKTQEDRWFYPSLAAGKIRCYHI
jgi:hypothetical protein